MSSDDNIALFLTAFLIIIWMVGCIICHCCAYKSNTNSRVASI